MEVVLDALIPALLIGTLFLPAIWTAISFSIDGRTLEESLYPGTTVGDFIVWVFAVSFVAIGASTYRYVSRWRAVSTEPQGDDDPTT